MLFSFLIISLSILIATLLFKSIALLNYNKKIALCQIFVFYTYNWFFRWDSAMEIHSYIKFWVKVDVEICFVSSISYTRIIKSRRSKSDCFIYWISLFLSKLIHFVSKPLRYNSIKEIPFSFGFVLLALIIGLFWIFHYVKLLFVIINLFGNSLIIIIGICRVFTAVIHKSWWTAFQNFSFAFKYFSIFIVSSSVCYFI